MRSTIPTLYSSDHTPTNESTSSPTSYSETPSSVAITTKQVAAIVETRPLDTLVPLILHFGLVLGPSWPIHIFTTQTNIPSSLPFKKALESQKIVLRHLPSKAFFGDHDAVSQFLTEPWIWDQLAPAEHVLFFQADSILCANAPMQVEDFLMYDFVGAPIDPNLGAPGFNAGFNGGLSLRNRSMTLDIIKATSWKEEIDKSDHPDDPKIRFEDQWFYGKMKEIGARLPTIETANKFSVETMWYDRPVGYHKIATWNMGRLEEIDRYCPEHRMATNLPIEDLIG